MANSLHYNSKQSSLILFALTVNTIFTHARCLIYAPRVPDFATERAQFPSFPNHARFISKPSNLLTRTKQGSFANLACFFPKPNDLFSTTKQGFQHPPQTYQQIQPPFPCQPRSSTKEHHFHPPKTPFSQPAKTAASMNLEDKKYVVSV